MCVQGQLNGQRCARAGGHGGPGGVLAEGVTARPTLRKAPRWGCTDRPSLRSPSVLGEGAALDTATSWLPQQPEVVGRC